MMYVKSIFTIALIILTSGTALGKKWYANNTGTGNICSHTHPCNIHNATMKAKSNDKIIIINNKTPLVINKTIVVNTTNIVLNCNNSMIESHENISIFTFHVPVGIHLKNCIFKNFFTLLQFNNNSEVNNQLRVCNCLFINFAYAINITEGSWNINIANSAFEGHVFIIVNFQLPTNLSQPFINNNQSCTNHRQILYHTQIINYTQIINHTLPFALVLKTDKVCDVTIQNCRFEGLSSALHWNSSCKHKSSLTVTNCNFTGNKLSLNETVFISGNVYVQISGTEFKNNIGEKGGALRIEKNSENVTIDKCWFRYNSAAVMGGACYFDSDVTIKDSHFIYNVVDTSLETDIAQTSSNDGGAVYNIGNLTLLNSDFINNTAPAFGGAVYHSATKDNTLLKIVNSSITGPSADLNLSYVGGLMYANALIDVNGLELVAKTAMNYGSLFYYYNVVHKSDELRSKTHLNLNMTCPINYRLQNRTVKNGKHSDSLIYFCSVCEIGTYNLSNSFNSFTDNESHKNSKNITCGNCPIGGVCNHGIKSRDNFWGSVTGSQTVNFISCPSGYCCTNGTCTSYNTCAPNRTGYLCGNCSKNHTESIYSSDCLKNDDCKPYVYWIICFLTAFCYVFVLLYFKEIVHFFNYLLKDSLNIPTKHLLFKIFRAEEKEENVVLLQNCTSGDQATPAVKANSTSTTGFLKVIIFFYQVELLLNINASSKNDYNLFKKFSVVEKIIAYVGSFKSFSPMCPYEGMNAVGKEFIKMLFIGIIFLIIGCGFALLSLRKYLMKGKNRQDYGDDCHAPLLPLNKLSFKLRLKCGFLQMILLCFLPAVTIMFQLLHCVHIFKQISNYTDIKKINNYTDIEKSNNYTDFKKISTIKKTLSLYICAHYDCFTGQTWWQLVIIILLVIWVFPFCFTLYWNIRYLEESKIGPNEFLQRILFPLRTVFYQIKSNRAKHVPKLSEEEVEEAKHLLHTFIAPYRAEKSYWEVVVIMRRMVLSIVYVYGINPVERLYLIILILSIILLDHLRTKPYKGKVLNWLETISLVILICFAAINIFWAESYLLAARKENFLGPLFIYMEVIILSLPAILFGLFLTFIIVTKLFFACSRCCRKFKTT
ncbi:uncharacterized protein LOC130657528 [Hydractinia symbiolongicarpus]|uniref:uncharacterized protein LOC130657528 n=1 Tax=Hydractinia symbiolongicarpus TaxID=13093 RepID=UPI002550CB0E|nr:uncharacterized protein LOC130657528 [Hydractinia symbiolongicarpus]